MSVVSVNADETLVAGTYIEGDSTRQAVRVERSRSCGGRRAVAGGARDNRAGSATEGPHYQATNKGQMMEARLAARLPLVLFTIRLEPGPERRRRPGDMKVLLHSTDWVNHLLFSPTDPQLLMYCHEGPWQKVDRIWMIHTDGTQQHADPQAHHGERDRRARVLGSGRRDDLVRLAVSRRAKTSSWPATT